MKNDETNTCTKVASVEIMSRHTIAPSNYCDIVVLFSLINYVSWCSNSFSLLARTYTLHGKLRACYELKMHRYKLHLSMYFCCYDVSLAFGIL